MKLVRILQVAVGIGAVAAALPSRAAIAYVSKSGSNTPPYSDLASAATNIMDAVAAAAVGATEASPGICYLAADTYTAENALDATHSHLVMLNVPVRIVGLGATPAGTVIDGADARRIASVTAAGASLENLTLTRARDLASGTAVGFAIEMSAGLVSNCVISAGTAMGNNRKEEYVRMTGGLLVDSEVSGLKKGFGVNQNDVSSRACVLTGTAVMRGCTVSGNTTVGLNQDAAVTAIGADVLVENCRITDNIHPYRALTHGAAGAAVLSGAILRGCEISGNVYQDIGANDGTRRAAGVYCEGGVIERCVITNNTARNEIQASGVYLYGSSLLLNSLVAGNRFQLTGFDRALAGGVVVDSATARMVNCTVVGNENPNSSRASDVYLSSGSIKNCLITRNGRAAVRSFASAATAPNVTYTRCDEMIAGAGNTTAEPRFRDAAGGDFALALGSPLLDAGAADAAVTNDLAGVRRVGSVDLGCFEFASDSPRADVMISSPAVGVPPFSFSATAVCSGGTPASYAWTVTDGATTLNGTDASFSQSVSTLGEWNVSCVVTFAAGAVSTARKTRAFRTGVRETWVSAAGSDTAPYDTEAKAAHRIMDAVNVLVGTAENPGVCHVAAGNYAASDCDDGTGSHLIVLDRPIRLVGMGATPAETVIDGANARRTARVAAKGAALENVTLYRGRVVGDASVPNGYGLMLEEGVVTDCVIASDRGKMKDNLECFVYATGGELVSSVISNFVSASYGTACLLVGTASMRDCLVANCALAAVDMLTAHVRRAAVMASGAGTSVEGCRICGNTMGSANNISYTGGAWIENGAEIRDTDISGNAISGGGGETGGNAFARAGGLCLVDARALRCRIERNVSNYRAHVGGVLIRGAGVLADSFVAGNSCAANDNLEFAGGVYLSSAAAQFVNCTIVSNVNARTDRPNGVWSTGGTITNAIIVMNGGDVDRQYMGTVTNAAYSCFATVIAGKGNLAADPRFVAPAKGDWRLSSSSPCRRAGARIGWLGDYIDGTLRNTSGAYALGCWPANNPGLQLVLK